MKQVASFTQHVSFFNWQISRSQREEGKMGGHGGQNLGEKAKAGKRNREGLLI